MTADSPVPGTPTDLATPTWTAAEALKILAEQAVVVAHHLLDYAPKGTMAEVSARGLLDTINTEVRSALGEGMFDFCPNCGTSGGERVMETSPAHQRCVSAGANRA